MRRGTHGAVCALLALLASGCGGAGPSLQSSSSEAPQSALPTGPLPHVPATLAARLTAADTDLRRAIGGWRDELRRHPAAPPREVVGPAHYLERAVALLADHQPLAAGTRPHLPPRLRSEIANLVAASRDLRRLSAGAHLGSVPLHTGPPTPLPSLRRFYAAAERRFGVGRDVLAAINFVESDFGRVRSRSVAGAQGPMQFIRSTWRTYGLGGDIRDPRDAILGAANLLRADGAPGDYAGALHAYNPSGLYVDAVERYARLLERDPAGLYLLYSW